MTVADDQLAVERVLGGEVSAFEELVRRWQTPLVNLAYRFCHDRGRAEEMAQEAFLRAYRNLKQWRREAAFSTWLFALATNFYRSEIHRIPVHVPIAEVPEPADPRAPHVGLEEQQRDRAVRHAVSALPEKYRDAIILFYFHEMDVPSAAASLGVPEGTLKARLFRGRRILREKLPHWLAIPEMRET